MLASNEYYLDNEMNSGLIDHNSASDQHDQDNMDVEEGQVEDGKYRPRQRRRQPPEAKKICRVCGDKAFSVNFNVVTCESCKAFFRRNALKTKELRCQTSGNCEISMQTRRSCKKCRLKKCLEVGMIKEWIMSDEARLRKRQLIEKNREKRQRLGIVNVKSGDLSDSDLGPRSTESERPAIDYKPIMCTIPTSVADYSAISHNWQSPSATVLHQPSPSSSALFQRSSSSVFQASPIMATSKPLHTMLPTEPAAPCSSQTVSQVEEMIRLPKTLLAALINQCHTAAITCPHVSQSSGHSSSRPSVIVSNKSTPLKCICRCRCGAKATWAPMGEEEPLDECPHIPQQSTTHHKSDRSSSDESDSDLDMDDSRSSGSSCYALMPKKRSRKFVISFKFGSNLSHVDDLLTAFDHFKHPLGKWKESCDSPQQLPHISRLANPGAVAVRLDTLCRRMVRFCKNIAMSFVKPRLLSRLVKACTNDLVMFHSLAAYNPEADAWYDKGPEIRPISTRDELAICKGGTYDEHLKFILSFPRVLKFDTAAILILVAMVLFNPDNAGEKDRWQVQLMRDFYSCLLTQYLESKFDADRARRLRENMLQHLAICPRVSIATLPTIVLELNEQDIEPMLIETLGYKYDTC